MPIVVGGVVEQLLPTMQLRAAGALFCGAKDGKHRRHGAPRMPTLVARAVRRSTCNVSIACEREDVLLPFVLAVARRRAASVIAATASAWQVIGIRSAPVSVDP